MTVAQKIAKVKQSMDNRYEEKSNKRTTISGSFSNDDTSYPTVAACLAKFGEIVTSWSAEPSDSKYPSEKLVKDALDTKISKSQTIGLVKNDGTIDERNFAVVSDIPSLTNYVQKSETPGLIKNDGTIDTNSYLTSSNLTNYVQKSETTGLIKNDGSIDSNQYLTAHQSLSDIGGVVTVAEKSSTKQGVFKTYQIKQNGTQVGIDIDIPKDFLVKSGSVKTAGSTLTDEEEDAGLTTGDSYISLIINTKDDNSGDGTELIIPANGLVEDTTYEADNSTLQLTGTTFSVRNSGITATQIATGAVESAKLADSAVITAKIADANVTSAKLASDSVVTTKILDANVTAAKLASDSVTTAKIADSNVTYDKLSAACITSIKSDADSEIEAALDALAEAIYPTASQGE